MNLCVNLFAVFVFLLIYGVDPHWTWLLTPVLLLPLIVFAAGVSMILSSLYVRYRDVAPIWAIVLADPLLRLAGALRDLDGAVQTSRTRSPANPLGMVMTQMRKWVIDPNAPSAAEAIGGYVALLIPIGVTLGLFALGFWVFQRETPRIAENL